MNTALKSIKFATLICMFFIIGCKTNNSLTKDDYDIMQIVLQHNLHVYPYDLRNDKALKGLKDGSDEYNKKISELFDKQSYESDYYYYIDETLFVFKENFYLEKLYKENDFDGSSKNLLPLKIDFSKIKTKKHLIRLDKDSPLRKSKYYIGEFKLSRIIYDGNKASIILIKDEFHRSIGFFKKEGNHWSGYGGGSIPFEFDERKIDL